MVILLMLILLLKKMATSHYGDSSKMFCVGNVSDHAKRLIDVTQHCLYLGILQVKSGSHLGDIGFAIEQHTKKMVIAWYKNIAVMV